MGNLLRRNKRYARTPTPKRQLSPGKKWCEIHNDVDYSETGRPTCSDGKGRLYQKRRFLDELQKAECSLSEQYL
jgi:hypothetical protein